MRCSALIRLTFAVERRFRPTHVPARRVVPARVRFAFLALSIAKIII